MIYRDDTFMNSADRWSRRHGISAAAAATGAAAVLPGRTLLARTLDLGAVDLTLDGGAPKINRRYWRRVGVMARSLAQDSLAGSLCVSCNVSRSSCSH